MMTFGDMIWGESKIHRFILMTIQLRQQMLFQELKHGSLDGWMPDLTNIFCPQCGGVDWNILNTKAKMNTGDLKDWSVYICKRCKFSYPPEYVSNKEVDETTDNKTKSSQH
jgi:hypothetical protein